MKKIMKWTVVFFLLVVFTAVCGCDNPFQKIGDSIANIDEPKEPDKTYEKVNVFEMSSEELKAHLQNGGYEAHIAQMKADYLAEEAELKSGDEPATSQPELFDAETPWLKGLEWIDLEAYGATESEEEAPSANIPEKYQKYIPKSIKEVYCQSVMVMDIISVDCTEAELKEIIALMKADGFEFYQEMQQDNSVYYQGAKQDGLACQITWGEGTGVLMFTDASGALE